MKFIIVITLLLGGLFFFTVGTVGLLRFPDVFTRAHASAKCDTLGVALCLSSLIVYNGISFDSIKLLIAICFLWITSPTAMHLIANAKADNYGSDTNEDI